MRYVRLNDSVVVEVDNFDDPEGRFHPSLVWVSSDAASIGDIYENGQFIQPARPAPQPAPAPTKEQLMAELAALTAKIQALE